MGQSQANEGGTSAKAKLTPNTPQTKKQVRVVLLNRSGRYGKICFKYSGNLPAICLNNPKAVTTDFVV